MKNSLSVLLVFSAVLSATGCKQDPPPPTSRPDTQQAAKAPAAPATAPAPAPAQKKLWGTATVSSPPGADGSPRRGIVRSTPDYNGAEVTRLNNGTQLNVLEAPVGGWHRVTWSVGSDSGEGYIHGDVLSVRPGG